MKWYNAKIGTIPGFRIKLGCPYKPRMTPQSTQKQPPITHFRPFQTHKSHLFTLYRLFLPITTKYIYYCAYTWYW